MFFGGSGITHINKHDMRLIRYFFKFLKYNDAYESYAENVYNNYLKRLNLSRSNSNNLDFNQAFLRAIAKLQVGDLYMINGEMLIRSAFVWLGTEQGHDYWWKMEDEWRKEYDKLKGHWIWY